jgi:cob(I)alamin adenosyltransferase
MGICRGRNSNLNAQLKNIQTNLLIVGTILAGSKKYALPAGRQDLRNMNYEIRKLEKEIDKMTKELPKLTNFIYPTGEIQVARAVCRRAERRIVEFINNAPSGPPLNPKNQKDSSLLTSFAVRGGRGSYIVKYLNRLGDYLFVLARWVNWKNQIEEEVWKGH